MTARRPEPASHADDSSVHLTHGERSMLSGERGEGTAFAMRLVVRLAEAMGATTLRPITGAHIDSCLFHGQAGLDFVRVLVDGRAEVAVPTTLNVSSLDLLHPDLFRGDDETRDAAKALMDAYVALGCRPTWTCAPYQLEARPGAGEHVAWAESNAIVFANSVLGARTHRYGDFIDIAAAITARVPDAGLHQTHRRRATKVVDVTGLPPALLATDMAYTVIGYIVGRTCGSEIPAIVGLPRTTTEDQLKALGATAASSGSLAMFHAVGITPEAATLEAACQGDVPDRPLVVTTQACRAARDALSTATTTRLATVSLGTPHYSVGEIGALAEAIADRHVHPAVDLYVSTGRGMLAEAATHGWVAHLERAGVTFVTDTCTYITPIVRDSDGVAMTDSGKWAYYAPGNLGVEVVFGSLQECVDSAVTGRIVRDPELWGDD